MLWVAGGNPRPPALSDNPVKWTLSTKNALYLSVNVFSTKVLIGDTINVSYWRRDGHFTWLSEPHEALAVCRTKEAPLFLRYFKTLSISPIPGIDPTTSRSAVKRSTNRAKVNLLPQKDFKTDVSNARTSSDRTKRGRTIVTPKDFIHKLTSDEPNACF